MIDVYWDFWIGGLLIAAIAFLITILTGGFLSVTRGFVSVCSIITQRPYFHTKDIGGKFGFRTLFFFGIITGGFVASLTENGWVPSFEYGQFDHIYGDSLFVKAAVLIVGGICWGYGSRIAKGCTSGNSISGLSKGSLASLVTTIGFMVSGISVTYLINYLMGTL